MEIIIVPDTNIFMEYKDVINSLLNDIHPFNINILVLEIVLDELDKIKLETNKAQNAIKFIQKISLNEMIMIEGNIKKNGMEVILDYGKFENCRTNDEKIIHIVSSINHTVLLTADRNMFLKAQSKNVKCVFIKDKDYLELKLEILMSQTESEPMEVMTDFFETNNEKLVISLLKPCIEQILINNIGPGYFINFSKDIENADLYKLLKICTTNFDLFDGYLHKQSKKILIEIQKNLKIEQDDEKKKELLQKILILFKINKEL